MPSRGLVGQVILNRTPLSFKEDMCLTSFMLDTLYIGNAISNTIAALIEIHLKYCAITQLRLSTGFDKRSFCILGRLPFDCSVSTTYHTFGGRNKKCDCIM